MGKMRDPAKEEVEQDLRDSVLHGPVNNPKSLASEYVVGLDLPGAGKISSGRR